MNEALAKSNSKIANSLNNDRRNSVPKNKNNNVLITADVLNRKITDNINNYLVQRTKIARLKDVNPEDWAYIDNSLSITINQKYQFFQ